MEEGLSGETLAAERGRVLYLSLLLTYLFNAGKTGILLFACSLYYFGQSPEQYSTLPK